MVLTSTGVKLTSSAWPEFLTRPQMRFADADIKSLGPVVKHQSHFYLWNSVTELSIVEKVIMHEWVTSSSSMIDRRPDVAVRIGQML